MSARQTWIIAYDISAPHRLARVFRLLSKQAISLQYSVFVADLYVQERVALSDKISKLIDHDEDDVRFYSTNEKTQITVFGRSRMPDGVMMFGEGAAGIAGGKTADKGRKK